MSIAKYIASAFHSREASDNWSKWEEANPAAARTLVQAAAEFKKIEGEFN